jgi:2,5-furandicarboxylate decarboxylase 1
MADLRRFLEQYEADHPERVWHIHDAVPRDYFVTAATLEAEKLPEPPVLVFHNVAGVAGPVVSGLFSSRSRIGYAIGTTADQLHSHWVERAENLIKPVTVTVAPCQEVCHLGDAADATTLPLMAHFEQDAGRYVTSGVVVAKDPDNGRHNLSFARMQLKGPRRFGISVHSRGHLWDYQRRAEARGQDLEAAVVIGMHPAYLIGAASRVGIDVDETDIVGALMGEALPVVNGRTVDVCVPAAAEYVIEGVILAGAREDEGPFGEYTGYATSRSTRNVFEVQAITHRREPWFLDVCPGLSYDHLLLGRVQKEAEVLRRLRQTLPNVRAIHYPISGSHYHCYIAIEKQRPGDGRHAALLALGLDSYIKLAIVVDDDINVGNENEVMWAVATRMQPADDTIIIDRMTCNVLDPSSEDGLSSKLLIDATRPLEGWDAERCTVPGAVVAEVRQLIERKVSGEDTKQHS